MAALRPVMLVILDGWGSAPPGPFNAISVADTPNFDRLWNGNAHAFLHTSGADVGLPDGQMGNSEVGHLNIGAGRVVMQDLPRIANAIADGSMAQAEPLRKLIAALQKSGGTCHLFGLMSPGGVHSHQDHAVALAKILVEAGIPVMVHVYTDGRDTPPEAGKEYLAAFQAALPTEAEIVTLTGRYFAMDRDKRWDRVGRAYRAMAEGDGAHFDTAAEAIADAYARKITDEFVEPAAIGDFDGMRDGDALLCFNFRADRVREILAAFLDPDFKGFERPRTIKFVAALGMTYYSDDLAPFMTTLFPPQPMTHLLGDVVAAAGLHQIRLAETEKYPHVTYFLNGGIETPNRDEDRKMAPSPKVATYDLQPEMSAPELCGYALEAIDSRKYDLLVLNFANPDMVGHTGSLPAAVKAVETVDGCLGQIADAIASQGGALLVTADHGNCEMMLDPETGGPHTSHTTNPVPVLLTNSPGPLHEGRLADIAPTLLALLGIAQPAEMTGKILFSQTA
jgi:2,3-bisphosphoglycerate-independent phosphoglycerate mutase